MSSEQWKGVDCSLVRANSLYRARKCVVRGTGVPTALSSTSIDKALIKSVFLELKVNSDLIFLNSAA